LALLEGRPRTATVRAVDESEVFEVDRGSFERLLADMVARAPEFGPSLQSLSELRALSCFAHLGQEELKEVLEQGAWLNIAPGEVIVREGDAGDAFYAISSGQVEVSREGQQVRAMGPGTFFGEVALLLDVPRTATVTARTPVRAFRLGREGFDHLVREAFRKGTLNPTLPQDRTWQH
jgi:CRP-like cAMP-binding protein